MAKINTPKHGRNFFQGEGQEEANYTVDGWNECVDAMNGAIKLLKQKTPEAEDP